MGVLIPVLSVAGDATPSSGDFTSRWISGVPLPDFPCGGVLLASASFLSGDGLAGLLVPAAPFSFSFVVAASRSARSCCLRSFFRSRLARSRSALSAAALLGVPFCLGSFGVSRPEPAELGGGVEGFDLLAGLRCSGSDFSAATGVPEPLVESVGVAAVCVPPPPARRADVCELGVGAVVEGVIVRRYA